MASHYTKKKIQILCHTMVCMVRPSPSLQLCLLPLFPLSCTYALSPSCYSRDFPKLISALGHCVSASPVADILSFGLNVTTSEDSVMITQDSQLLMTYHPIYFLYCTYHDLKLFCHVFNNISSYYLFLLCHQWNVNSMRTESFYFLFTSIFPTPTIVLGM